MQAPLLSSDAALRSDAVGFVLPAAPSEPPARLHSARSAVPFCTSVSASARSSTAALIRGPVSAAASVSADGRALLSFRPAAVELSCVGTADSSAIVLLGRSCLLCTATLELCAPLATQPHAGFLTVGLQLAASTAAAAGSSSSSSRAASSLSFAALSARLQSLLIQRSLPLSWLSVAAGRSCFLLHLDLSVLSNDGGLMDAALMAALTTLSALRLPDLEEGEGGEMLLPYDGHNGGKTECRAGRAGRAGSTGSTGSAGRRLQPASLPVVTGFCLVGSRVLCDASADEEELSDAMLRVAVDEHSGVVDVWKAGGAAMSREEIAACIAVAKQRTTAAVAMIRSAVATAASAELSPAGRMLRSIATTAEAG